MNQKLVNFLTPIVALFFAAALGVTAATTIGTDITTEGDLDVAGSATIGSMELVDVDGFPTIDSPGDTVDLKIDNTGGGDIDIEASGGGEVTLNGAVRFPVQTGEPTSCGQPTEGTLAYAANDGQFCFCNGTDWVLIASTTVTCVFSAPDDA